MLRLVLAFGLLSAASACASVPGRPTPYAGMLAGISTLSADGTAVVALSQAEASLYKPENGLALNLFAGAHLSDYVSVQGNYIWNRNALALSSLRTVDGAFFEEHRRSQQHSIVGDGLLYFRNRQSWVRPYLSAGLGVARFKSDGQRLAASRAAVGRPPAVFERTDPVLRIAVGIDIHHGLAGPLRFRYSFSETIGDNPISAQLSPVPPRNLANFQNLFGLVASF
jgi:hypothetical protein